MTPSVCPLGHQVADDERFCPECQYEAIPNELVDLDPGTSELRRVIELDPAAAPLVAHDLEGSRFALGFYVLAVLAFLVGCACLDAFVTIRRGTGVTNGETVGILVITTCTVIVPALMCFCGYVIDLLRDLSARLSRG